MTKPKGKPITLAQARTRVLADARKMERKRYPKIPRQCGTCRYFYPDFPDVRSGNCAFPQPDSDAIRSGMWWSLGQHCPCWERKP